MIKHPPIIVSSGISSSIIGAIRSTKSAEPCSDHRSNRDQRHWIKPPERRKIVDFSSFTENVLHFAGDALKLFQPATATIYRKMDAGRFAPKVRLSVNIIAWYESDVAA